MKRLPKIGRKKKGDLTSSTNSTSSRASKFGRSTRTERTVSDILSQSTSSTATQDDDDDEFYEPKQEILLGTRRGNAGAMDKISAQMRDLHVKAGSTPMGVGKIGTSVPEDGEGIAGKKVSAKTADGYQRPKTSRCVLWILSCVQVSRAGGQGGGGSKTGQFWWQQSWAHRAITSELDN